MNRSKALVVAILLLTAFAVGTTASAGRSPARAAQTARQLRGLNHQIALAINAFRVARGLAPLQVSLGLARSSRQHSLEMGARGYFDHPSADGTAFWKRIQQYYTDSGYPYWTVGENLLWATSSISAEAAMKQWIRSPQHLANLKSKDWLNLGVSSVRVVGAGGIFRGDTVTLITTDFGARHD